MQYHYHRLLIISDNARILTEIAKINQEKIGGAVQFEYGISPFSDLGHFQYPLFGKVKVLDLRHQSTVLEIIESYDLVVSVHCKQIFPPLLVRQVKCVNLHPGYNPINRGWYPQVFAIIHDLAIGATLHEIDEELDHGAIIDRVKVPKHAHDTSFSLYARVVEAEINLWEKNVISLVSANYQPFSPEEEGKLYLKKDFNSLLKLDLAEKMTMKQAIDRLRALTFNGYRNAYFIDERGEKVFVEITLTPEK